MAAPAKESANTAAEETIPELVVKEGDDIDYRVVLAAYVLADLGFHTPELSMFCHVSA
jgi:hypothetical protein